MIEKNIRLGFRKGWVILKRFTLLLINKKKHNKKFVEFEFEYFGGSDVANKLKISKTEMKQKMTYIIHIHENKVWFLTTCTIKH